MKPGVLFIRKYPYTRRKWNGAKKLKKMLLMSLIILLTACSNEESGSKEEVKEVDTASSVENENNQEEAEEVEVNAVSEHPFPSNTNSAGNATILITTPAGDTSNGNVPVLFVSEDDSMIQIGIDYEEFDGSVETFVYINEIFNTSEQIGERSQSSLTLSEGNLEPGEYTVTAVQFEDNDPAKAPINLTEAKFKIEKSS